MGDEVFLAVNLSVHTQVVYHFTWMPEHNLSLSANVCESLREVTGREAAEGKESAYSLDGERILAGGRRLRFTNLWMGNVQLGTPEGNRSTVATRTWLHPSPAVGPRAERLSSLRSRILIFIFHPLEWLWGWNDEVRRNRENATPGTEKLLLIMDCLLTPFAHTQ